MGYYRACGWETVVGVGSGADDQVDFIGLYTCGLKESIYSNRSHVGRTLTLFLQDVTGLNAHTCCDPLVVCIDHFGQHLVVEDVFGYV